MDSGAARQAPWAEPGRPARRSAPGHLFFQRMCTILRTTGAGVRRGQERDREMRSAMPAVAACQSSARLTTPQALITFL